MGEHHILNMNITLTREQIKELAEIYLREIRLEARRAFSRKGWDRQNAKGLDIEDSFSYRLTEDGFTLICTYPGIDRYLSGKVVKQDDDGNLILDTMVLSREDFWLAPGFQRGNFIYQGMERARSKVEPILMRAVEDYILNHPEVILGSLSGR